MNVREHLLQRFETLLQEGQSILNASGWNGRHFHELPGRVDYLRFRTEALNLVRRACGDNSDHYRELRGLAERDTIDHPSNLSQCFGIFQAAFHDFEAGLLFDLRSLIAAELLGDFVEQATHLLEQGYHVPAASLAGAVLEDMLRKLCDTHSIAYPTRTKIDSLNVDLAKAKVYNTLVQKQITAWADLRNNADHGRFDKIKPQDVGEMITWVRRFGGDYIK